MTSVMLTRVFTFDVMYSVGIWAPCRLECWTDIGWSLHAAATSCLLGDESMEYATPAVSRNMLMTLVYVEISVYDEISVYMLSYTRLHLC